MQRKALIGVVVLSLSLLVGWFYVVDDDEKPVIEKIHSDSLIPVPNDDAALSLMEIRFHIPQSSENPDADPVSVSAVDAS